MFTTCRTTLLLWFVPVALLFVTAAPAQDGTLQKRVLFVGIDGCRFDAIETVDANMGRVLAALRARKSLAREDWLIVVTSDHGGTGFSHGGKPNVPEVTNSFLIVSGAAAARGKFDIPVFIVDAPVTVIPYLGIDLRPDWTLDGRAVGLKP